MALLRTLIAEEPARADWWIAQESWLPKTEEWQKRGLRNHKMAQFSKRWTYAELRNPAQSDWIDEAGIDCFCGD